MQAKTIEELFKEKDKRGVNKPLVLGCDPAQLASTSSPCFSVV